MTINEITVAANYYTDEQVSPTIVRYYVNECISKINIELRTILPLVASVNDPTYTAISESWQTTLLVPYTCYSIKMNDGSLNEADRYKVVFNENLARLIEEKNRAIDSAYRGTDFTAIYRSDPTMGINTGWFRRKSDGGF